MQGTQPRWWRCEDRPLGGVGHEGDPGEALGLQLEGGGSVDGEGDPLGDRLQELDVVVAVAAPGLGVDQRERTDDPVTTRQWGDDRAGEAQAAQDRQVLLVDSLPPAASRQG